MSGKEDSRTSEDANGSTGSEFRVPSSASGLPSDKSRAVKAIKTQTAPIANGIDSFQVTAARELFQLTTSSRFPGRNKPNQASTSSIRPSKNPLSPTTPKPSASVVVPAKGHVGKCNNPQCQHCGTVIIPSPAASFPIKDSPSISINDWELYTCRNPILNASEIEHYESILSIPVPEMIFGNNRVDIQYKDLFSVNFNALDALKLVLLNPEDLIQVSYANDWFKSRQKKLSSNEDVVLEMYRPYDWTYSTLYRGTVLKGEFIRDDECVIPLEKLKRQDPILFYDDMILYEDELGDNGISILNIKIRAMGSCMLLLQRLFIRVDNVLIRIYDTRLYIDFDTNQIIREFKRQELDYDNLLKLCYGNDPRSLLRDINWCASKLPVVEVQREYMNV